MSKQATEIKVDEDEQYLVDSISEIQTRLATFRYNIKEIKSCLLVAITAKNDNRIRILQEQKGKTNELIKLGLEDQRRVLSIYKKIKRGNNKK